MRRVLPFVLLVSACGFFESVTAPRTSAHTKLLDRDAQLTAKGGAIARTEFTVPVTAGDNIVIEANTTAFDPLLEVTPPGGETIRNDDFRGSRQKSQVSVFVRTAGTMRIAVTSPIETAAGAFHVTATRTGNVRTDPATARVPMVEPGQQITGSLATGDEVLPDGRFNDHVVAMGPPSGSVELRLTAQTPIVPLALVLDPQGQPIVANAAGTYVLSQPAAYRIQLMTPLRGQTASYTLSVTANATNAPTTVGRRHHQLPPDLRATPLAAGSETQGVLNETAVTLPTGELAVAYDLEATAAANFVIALESEVFDPYLLVIAPNGQTWENDDAGGSRNAEVELTTPTAGRYRIVATAYQRDMRGKFVLKVQSAQRGQANAAGSTNAPSTAATNDAPIRGELAAGDTTLDSGEFVDRYTRSFPRGTPFSVRVSSRNFDSYVIVKSPSGHQEDNDDLESGNTDAGVDIPSAEEGEYTVLVTSYRANEVGAYTLSFASTGAASPRAAEPAEPGEPSQPAANTGNPVDSSGGRVFGVFAGISDYPGSDNDLDECANDATKLSESLERAGLVTADRRVLLTNSQATVANVRAGIERFAQQAGPNDIFVFFWSGHGSQEENSRDTREIDATDESIVLYDGEILDDAMGQLFDHSHARVSLLALDSCFAGGFAKDVITRPGRVGFFSSEEDVESSVASQFEAGGYLSYFMRTGVAGEADTTPRDGALTVGELEHFLYRQFGSHAMDVEMQGAFQHLVVDRGAVRSTEVLWRYR